MNNQPLLQLTDAVVRRDGRDILSIDSLKIEEGDRLVVLGPNGSGKSTLVKLLTREMLPLWRETPPVLFMGEPRPVVSDMRKIIGIVSMTMQDQITVHLPAIEVVLGGFFGALGVPQHCSVTPEQEEIARAALDELNAAALADRDICTLSTGQARRVLIARALVNDPRIIVFDEPCTGLDPQAIWHVRQSFRSLAKAGRTILLVTHYVEDIMPEFNRVVMLNDGSVIADGAKEEILTTERMRNLFDVPIEVEERDGFYRLW